LNDGLISPISLIAKWLSLATYIWDEPWYERTLHNASEDLVIWLDAAESISQELCEVLPWSPKAEKADIIICWTISGVRLEDPTAEGVEGIPGAEEEITVA
jgi:hypothetical protein